MATLIKNRRIARDSWWMLDAGDSPAGVPAGADIVVPLARWRAGIAPHAGRTGVWLAGDEAPEAIASGLTRLPLIAIRFAKFADGRGYSTARLLRERYDYRGELRAIGDIGRDQLAFLERSGFDAFELREGINAQHALAAFDEVSVVYQPDARVRVRLEALA